MLLRAPKINFVTLALHCVCIPGVMLFESISHTCFSPSNCHSHLVYENFLNKNKRAKEKPVNYSKLLKNDYKKNCVQLAFETL